MEAGRAPAAMVAVPVRNEAPRLRRLLLALAGQREAPPFGLALFFDACTDDSREIVAALGPRLPYPIVSEHADAAEPPNAGRARALAAALALRHRPDAALLTTDADSEPAADWVAASLAALERADIVAGRIVLDDPERAPVQVRLGRYYDRLYARRRQLDPVGWEDAETHHWTSGASLAFRPGVYRPLAGFSPLARGEDADIVDRAWRLGFRVRRDARVVVRTSTRRRGRAPAGFAAGLARAERTADLPLVGHPDDEQWRFRRHAEARRAYASGQPARLAAVLGLDPAELIRIAAEVPNADAFAARVVGAPPGGMRHVSLAHAEALLGVDDLGEVA